MCTNPSKVFIIPLQDSILSLSKFFAVAVAITLRATSRRYVGVSIVLSNLGS